MSKGVATVFVVDALDFVIMHRKLDKDCIYPSYRFDNAYAEAKDACEDIAITNDKLVMNAVFSETDPYVYNPQTGVIGFETKEEPVDDYRSKLKGIIA